MKQLFYRLSVIASAALIILLGIIFFNIVKSVGPIKCLNMNIVEAVVIAEKSSCTKEGFITLLGSSCNEFTKTWWLGMAAVGHSGCAPACVVDLTEKTAEVNWRCTGALMHLN